MHGILESSRVVDHIIWYRLNSLQLEAILLYHDLFRISYIIHWLVVRLIYKQKTIITCISTWLETFSHFRYKIIINDPLFMITRNNRWKGDIGILSITTQISCIFYHSNDITEILLWRIQTTSPFLITPASFGLSGLIMTNVSYTKERFKIIHHLLQNPKHWYRFCISPYLFL